jgi:bacillaene synthase trans-acting acyltransferase
MTDVKKPRQMTRDHRIVFLFSGQGSHYRGMGEKLFKNSPVFAQALYRSDVLIQKRLGRSLIRELYSGGPSSFEDLRITHPAIVSIELALWSVLSTAGVRPDYVTGSSLGEFPAAAVCGVWSPESALEAAMEQAQSIAEHNEKGGMLAIMDISEAALSRLTARYNLHIASNNFPGHYTLSGATPNLDALEVTLKASAIPYLRLPVTYPFHSPLLTGGKTEFLHYMRTNPQLEAPGAGFVSGLHGRGLTHLPDDYFWDVVSQPANFADTVAALEERGPCLYVDLGPSGTGATFVNYNLPASSSSIVHRIMTPFKQEERQLQGLFELLETRNARTGGACA